MTSEKSKEPQTPVSFSTFVLAAIGLHLVSVFILYVFWLIFPIPRLPDLSDFPYFVPLFFAATYMSFFVAGTATLFFSELSIIIAFATTRSSTLILGRTPFWLYLCILPICSYAYSMQWAFWQSVLEGAYGAPFNFEHAFSISMIINAPVLLAIWYLNKRQLLKDPPLYIPTEFTYD